MDGLLIVDKPSGPTSHDVVARVRRILRERRVGHTGTLDPMASGVLPLVIGRATRLARFISGDKTYDAAIRLGVNTDTYDARGEVVGNRYDGPWPSFDAVDRALDPFRGTFLQQPPIFSAKKVAGTRSYDIARRRAAGDAEAAIAAAPKPVEVTTHRIELIDLSTDLVQLRVCCSAGFYVRALAHDLGTALGTGAHLVELRRTEAAGAHLSQAVPLDALEASGGRELAERSIVGIDRMLDELPTIALTSGGVERVRVGRDIGADDAAEGSRWLDVSIPRNTGRAVRLLDPAGRLVAMAEPTTTPGVLHPAVVLM